MSYEVLCGSFWWYCVLVCTVWMWYFLIILAFSFQYRLNARTVHWKRVVVHIQKHFVHSNSQKMESISLNSFVLLQHLAILLTSTLAITQKLLKQGYWYYKLRKTFSKFYRRYYDLITKFQVGLKSLLRHGLSEPGFYGDLV